MFMIKSAIIIYAFTLFSIASALLCSESDTLYAKPEEDCGHVIIPPNPDLPSYIQPIEITCAVCNDASPHPCHVLGKGMQMIITGIEKDTTSPKPTECAADPGFFCKYTIDCDTAQPNPPPDKLNSNKHYQQKKRKQSFERNCANDQQQKAPRILPWWPKDKYYDRYCGSDRDKTIHTQMFAGKGHLNIESIKYCKVPVKGSVLKATTKLTGTGTDLASQIEERGVPNHAFLILTRSDHKELLFEKNEIVEINAATAYDSKSPECEELVENTDYPPINFINLVKKAEERNHCLYVYTAAKYNCQDFAFTIIDAALAGTNPAKKLAVHEFLVQSYDFDSKGRSRTGKIMGVASSSARYKAKFKRGISSITYKRKPRKGESCETRKCHEDCNCIDNICDDKSVAVVCPDPARVSYQNDYLFDEDAEYELYELAKDIVETDRKSHLQRSKVSYSVIIEEMENFFIKHKLLISIYNLRRLLLMMNKCLFINPAPI